MQSKAVLLRLREKDTGNGVTRNTLKLLAKTLGISETDAIHKALAESARTHLPQYKADDGPLTVAQHAAIARTVKKSHGQVRVLASLFNDDELTGKPHRAPIRATARAR